MGHETWRARRWQAPEEGWRTTIASGRMASRFRAVSASVSPFDTLELAALMLMVSAESRLAAISNEVRVRVLVSEKRLMTVFPPRGRTFLMSRSEISLTEAPVS